MPLWLEVGATLVALWLTWGAIQASRPAVYLTSAIEGNWIVIRASRRVFNAWPDAAKKDSTIVIADAPVKVRRLEKPPTAPFPDTMQIVRIRVDSENADENLIEAVVEAKRLVGDWCGNNEEAQRLQKQAKKALKR